jgi:DNA modification methylase
MDNLTKIINQVLHGDIRTTSQIIPDNCIQAIITSPPYFGHRNYTGKDSCESEIGREKNLKNYIENLVICFEVLKPKLKDDGLLWLNLGDTYRNKELQGVPWRVAFALKDRGWILRSDIIWKKSNAMPSSVKNRPTVEHEYIFLFSKTNDYYYDADSIREPHVTFTAKSKMKGGRNHFGKRNSTPENGKNSGNQNLHNGRWDQAFHPKGRNKRTVWEIPLGKFRDTHFAVYPEALVETCLFASTKKGNIVLDPFTGSGTTGVVAIKHERKFIGCELVKTYQEMAQKRLDEIVIQPSLF